MNIGELFLTLGIKKGSTVNDLTNIGFKFLTLKKTAEELGNIFESLFSDVMKKAVNLANVNKITGISIKQMQEMKYKAEQVGISYEDWLGSVKAIQKGVADINMGNENGLFSLLQKLDLNINDYTSSADMLNAIMSKAMQYEEGYRNALLSEAGISESMVVMYSEKYKAIEGSLLLTKEEIAQQKELNQNWYHLKQTVSAIKDKEIAKMGETLSVISEIIANIIVNTIRDMGALMKTFSKFGEVLGSIISQPFKWLNTTGSFVGGLIAKFKNVGGTDKEVQNAIDKVKSSYAKQQDIIEYNKEQSAGDILFNKDNLGLIENIKFKELNIPEATREVEQNNYITIRTDSAKVGAELKENVLDNMKAIEEEI